ncbi:TetR/AcrR family transcriptional regulator [Actinokineospora bangkokensis]|uniref:TetR family transcriptional regulator n=1 Tax=Actinokineospora bangkokensis TaxID=1193682 RepID=A0A1Q9LI75_9PSEU|nr:TetR/AcrR family transcriptional regulator [Actinokineospora bangkokensis]OLR91752.1 TetR family transcriptional regulator [Actinokineospora bangkokensis]
MDQRPSLRERKRAKARHDIVAAAYALFTERGYAQVTVADIAERAEVGRTTFFRHFGDKQEVVFAGEQELLDELRARYEPMPVAKAPDLGTALELLRGVVLSICAESVSDPAHYRLRERLIAQNAELADRGARKLAALAELAGEILRGLGAEPRTAVLAPLLARACFQAGRELAGHDPAALIPQVTAAFDSLAGQVGRPG